MTNELVLKEVEFNGNTLIAVQLEDNDKIYVGASWVCDGIGLNKNGKDAQVKKIQSDIVLKQGYVKFDAGVFDPNNETAAIELDFLPLWLAKISITPKMQKDSPEVVENLVKYQLKAKDVLAKAFIEEAPYILPQNYKEALTQLLSKVEENEVLRIKNEEMLPKAQFHDNVSESVGTDDLTSVAKSLGIGRNRFASFLRSAGILFQDGKYNIPKQLYQNQGYFEVTMKTYPVEAGYGTSYKTVVTGKGKTWLHKVVQKYGGAEVISKVKISDIDEYVKNIQDVS